MECTYCGAKLEWHDSYGNHDYVCHGVSSGKRGDIFKCPNHEGFETKELAMEFIQVKNEEGLNTYLKENQLESWEEIVCDSASHNVSGSFYTDRNENLHEGYPC